MEAFGYWKCVVSLVVIAIVQTGEGMLWCSLTCPNQQLSCTVDSNEQFILQGHSAYGQRVKLEPMLMGIPASLVELAVTGCEKVDVVPEAFDGLPLLKRLNFSNIQELTFQEDSLVFTGDLALDIDQVSSLKLHRHAITFNASREVAQQHLQVINTHLSVFHPEAIVTAHTTKYLTTFGENNTLEEVNGSNFCDVSHVFRDVFIKDKTPIPCSSVRALGSVVVIAVAFLFRKVM
ncbi:uncharacterized protein LOC125032895 [Penaeus chinensis]|uniref:uncharacterized protein LOC125032895 n=1 Tax=Penaeus chinensis TaxID=139456 RepID=UPI001FB7765F|nr:uncharacterized protein LOC125032895 [Penaeus chinensis]